MDLQTAQHKLSLAIKKQEELRKEQQELKNEIKILKDIIRKHRLVKPQLSSEEITKRNKEIFVLWAEGTSFEELSMKYHISVQRVKDICKWIEGALNYKRGLSYERYESLKNIKPKISLLSRRDHISITRAQQILRY